MSAIEDLKKRTLTFPGKPGVYQFMNSGGDIIYVGKAKDLKKRVSSYFSKNQSGKTQIMLKKASDIKIVVVDHEEDALLLENNLIKQYQPRYNILLKDDKTYPWICIKNERFPRVFSTRNHIKDGSVYFGPYTSGLMVKTILELIRSLFKIRNCPSSLTIENINNGKFKVCLEYHLGNCKAPCIGLQDESDYNFQIDQIKEILKGHIGSVLEHLKQLMQNLSEQLRFEEAQLIKEKIEILTRFRAKSTIVSNSIKNVDVFGISDDSDKVYISYLKVNEGAVIQAFTLDIKCSIEEEKQSLLAFAIAETRDRFDSDSTEIIVPFSPDIKLLKVKYVIPERGDKLKLLQLAERNATYYKLEQKKRKEEFKPKDRTSKNLEKLKNDLHMSSLPIHIECFDNSNISGKIPVAACVVFRNAKPSKKEYRHFNIKTVTGPDDYSSMQEIVFRRYKRMIEEKQTLPQLIVIDGGKGQLSSAVKSLESLGIHDKVTIIGIAKKLEEIYFPGDKIPVYIDKTSISLKIIQHLRNEAHRFGISFHRNKRSADMLKSEFDHIKGIGIKTKELLIKEIGSLEKIKSTPEKTLINLVGKQKTKILMEYFSK